MKKPTVVGVPSSDSRPEGLDSNDANQALLSSSAEEIASSSVIAGSILIEAYRTFVR